MVPSDGFVLTPVTKLPTSGMAFWMVCLMPSAVQVIVASSAPIVPFELPLSCSRTSSMLTLAFMPLASRIWLPAVSIEMLP